MELSIDWAVKIVQQSFYSVFFPACKAEPVSKCMFDLQITHKSNIELTRALAGLVRPMPVAGKP